MSGTASNEGIEKTPDLLKQLIQKCFEAKEKAYSPYSKFRVGAALLTECGEFITGKTFRSVLLRFPTLTSQCM